MRTTCELVDSAGDTTIRYSCPTVSEPGNQGTMLKRLGLISFVCFWLVACGTGAGVRSGTATGDLPATDVRQSDYHLLLAEMANQEGNYALASSEYRRAALLNASPEVAERATRMAFDHGYIDDALVSAQHWVRLSPDDRQARVLLASLMLETGDADGATAHFRYYIEHAESTVNVAFMDLLPLFQRVTDTRVATEVMRRLTKPYPDSARAQFVLANLALGSQDYDLALESSESARQLDPDWIAAGMSHARALQSTGQTEEALDVAQQLVIIDRSIETRLDYILMLVSAREYDDARLELMIVLDEFRGEADALRIMGYLDILEDDLESAQDRFTEMLATGRNTGDAYYYLGNIAERQEDYPRALRLYARVGTGPNVIAAQIRAASVLEELDDGQAGLDHLQGFADANPRHRSTMALAKGNLLVRMDRGDDAFVWYDEYLTEYPDDDSVRYQRAFLYERFDRVDEAIAELHLILDDNTNDPFALNALGYTLADRTTRYREAQRYIKKAYTQEPYNAAIVDSMGWIMYRRGKLEQALEYLKRAYRLDDDPEIAAHLGEVLWVSGNETAADEIWQGALKVYPNNGPLREIVDQFVK